MPGPPPSLRRRLLRHLRVHREAYSDGLLAAGAWLTLLAIGYFTPLSGVEPFPAINAVTAQPSANYNLLFAILGPIVVIVGGYFAGSYYAARVVFERHMRTRSKAEFLRSIPEVEAALADLTPRDEERYLAKLEELRIRR